MNTHIITREITPEELAQALEFYYRSLGIIKRYQEVSDAQFTKGPIYVTFTVKDSEDGGVERNSFSKK